MSIIHLLNMSFSKHMLIMCGPKHMFNICRHFLFVEFFRVESGENCLRLLVLERLNCNKG